jgi:hypothetical protein
LANLCNVLRAKFEEVSFHALRCIRLLASKDVMRAPLFAHERVMSRLITLLQRAEV